MQSDYEIEAHAAYRMDTARELRHQISLAEQAQEDEKPVERRPRWSFRIPRLVHRTA